MTPYFRKLAVMAAAGGAVVALAGAGAATASVPTSPKATIQCQAAGNGRCVSIDMFNGLDGSGNEYVLETRGVFQNAQVHVAAFDSSNPAQDFRVTIYGTVGGLTNSGDGPFAYGLTQDDNNLYGNGPISPGDSPVWGGQFSPYGVDSGFCLANISNHLVLRHCRNSRWQRFIGARTLWASGNTSADGAYGMSVVRSDGTADGHLVATGAPHDGALVLFKLAQNLNQNQDWDFGDAADNGGNVKAPK